MHLDQNSWKTHTSQTWTSPIELMLSTHSTEALRPVSKLTRTLVGLKVPSLCERHQTERIDTDLICDQSRNREQCESCLSFQSHHEEPRASDASSSAATSEPRVFNEPHTFTERKSGQNWEVSHVDFGLRSCCHWLCQGRKLQSSPSEILGCQRQCLSAL